MNRTKCADGVCAALFSLLAAAAAQAATFTWDGGGANFGWNDDANWVGNVEPPKDGTADIRFEATSKHTSFLTDDWNIRSLGFANSAPGMTVTKTGTHSLTIQGGGFGIGMTNLSTESQTFENDVLLGGSQIWSFPNGIVAFLGDIFLINHTLSLFDSGSGVIFAGRVTGGADGELMKNGDGELLLSGNEPNVFSGTTTVNAGALHLGKSAMGVPAVAGPLVIGDGSGGLEADKVVWFADGQTAGAVTVNISGLVDLNGNNQTINDLTLIGGRVRTGAGTLTLPSVVTSEPSITSALITDAGGGTYSLGLPLGTTTFDVADGLPTEDLEIDGSLTGPPGRGLLKSGAGRLVLSGLQNTYIGTTFVTGGTLVLEKSSSTTDGAIHGDLVIGMVGPGPATVLLALNNQIHADAGNQVTVGPFGTLNLDGWTDTIGPLIMAGGQVVTDNGVLTVPFGVTSQASSQTATISGNLDLNGSVQTFAVANGSPAVDLHVSARIQDGGVNKTGVGRLAFSGANTYTGPTTVNGGTLLVNNTSGSGTGSGSVAVNASSTLGGDGNMSGSVSVASAGVLAPGNSIGDLAVGAVAFGSGARFLIELGGLNAGTEFDQLIVAGDALLNGLLNVPLVGGFVPAQGDMFEILTAGNVIGQFSLLGLPAVASGTGLTWQVHYNPGDVTLEVLTALLGDYNGNGVVDAPDYVVWRNTLGQSPPGLAADGDGDGVVDADDYNIWKAHFGQSAGSAGASANAAVSEPATWILIILAAGVSGKRWPHRKSQQRINA